MANVAELLVVKVDRGDSDTEPGRLVVTDENAEATLKCSSETVDVGNRPAYVEGPCTTDTAGE